MYYANPNANICGPCGCSGCPLVVGTVFYMWFSFYSSWSCAQSLGLLLFSYEGCDSEKLLVIIMRSAKSWRVLKILLIRIKFTFFLSCSCSHTPKTQGTRCFWKFTILDHFQIVQACACLFNLWVKPIFKGYTGTRNFISVEEGSRNAVIQIFILLMTKRPST